MDKSHDVSFDVIKQLGYTMDKVYHRLELCW